MTKKEMVAYIKSEEERLYKELEQFEKDFGVEHERTEVVRAEWSAVYQILRVVSND